MVFFLNVLKERIIFLLLSGAHFVPNRICPPEELRYYSVHVESFYMLVIDWNLSNCKIRQWKEMEHLSFMSHC